MATKPKQFVVTKESVVFFAKGLVKAIPDGTSVMVNTVNYTKADLIAKFTACEGLYDAEEAALLAATQATTARVDGVAAMEPFANGLASMLVTMIGADAAAGCGVEVGKEKAKLSAEAEADRLARMLATREARGTKGKRQKEKIKGVLPKKDPPADGSGGNTP